MATVAVAAVTAVMTAAAAAVTAAAVTVAVAAVVTMTVAVTATLTAAVTATLTAVAAAVTAVSAATSRTAAVARTKLWDLPKAPAYPGTAVATVAVESFPPSEAVPLQTIFSGVPTYRRGGMTYAQTSAES